MCYKVNLDGKRWVHVPAVPMKSMCKHGECSVTTALTGGIIYRILSNENTLFQFTLTGNVLDFTVHGDGTCYYVILYS